jgi:hypothetical protein
MCLKAGTSADITPIQPQARSVSERKSTGVTTSKLYVITAIQSCIHWNSAHSKPAISRQITKLCRPTITTQKLQKCQKSPYNTNQNRRISIIEIYHFHILSLQEIFCTGNSRSIWVFPLLELLQRSCLTLSDENVLLPSWWIEQSKAKRPKNLGNKQSNAKRTFIEKGLWNVQLLSMSEKKQPLVENKTERDRK